MMRFTDTLTLLGLGIGVRVSERVKVMASVAAVNFDQCGKSALKIHLLPPSYSILRFSGIPSNTPIHSNHCYDRFSRDLDPLFRTMPV